MEGIRNLSYSMLGASPVELDRRLQWKLPAGYYQYISGLNEREFKARLQQLFTPNELSFLGISSVNPNNQNKPAEISNVISLPARGRLNNSSNRLDFAA